MFSSYHNICLLYTFPIIQQNWKIKFKSYICFSLHSLLLDKTKPCDSAKFFIAVNKLYKNPRRVLILAENANVCSIFVPWR